MVLVAWMLSTHSVVIVSVAIRVLCAKRTSMNAPPTLANTVEIVPTQSMVLRVVVPEDTQELFVKSTSTNVLPILVKTGVLVMMQSMHFCVSVLLVG
jgi:hypothetical protein